MAAVGSERISQVVGYLLKGGDFSQSTPNLPQRIAILAEVNHANQSAIGTAPVELTSARQAGDLFGYGSPIYNIMRILRPVFGGGTIGGIPTVFYPQAEAAGAAARTVTITATGTANGNATHRFYIAGRTGLDGQFYDVNVETGDTSATIAAKLADAVNAVLGSPVSASNVASPPSSVTTLTAKWYGLTSQDVVVEEDPTNKDVGVTYAVQETQAGSGTPSISSALALFGNEWNTIVINSYGTVTAIMDALEAFNGIPDPETPTGRYTGIIMKPFIALTGSVAADPSSITDSRADDVTIAICPAPLSSGLPMEAAANMCALFARIAQDNPELDVLDKTYPDMPVPTDRVIGVMADYDERDRIVKKGCSTVDILNGKYRVKDFVTTYHKEGELPPQFRYARNLNIDWNIRFSYYLKEAAFVVGHVLANDGDSVFVSKVVKPKIWKSILAGMFEDLVERGIIVDAAFSIANTSVAISSTNPDRFDTEFSYKRSGFGRINSTTATAGFNFGGA